MALATEWLDGLLNYLKTMLNPVYFTPLPGLQSPGSKYEIIWYCQIQEFTLLYVRYTPSDKLQRMEFEVLYQDDRYIAGSEYEGRIEGLYAETPQKIILQETDPRKAVPQNVGKFGIAPEVAISLRSEANRIYFQS